MQHGTLSLTERGPLLQFGLLNLLQGLLYLLDNLQITRLSPLSPTSTPFSQQKYGCVRYMGSGAQWTGP